MKRFKRQAKGWAIAAAIGCVTAAPAHAQDVRQCLMDAAAYWRVPVDLAFAIAMQESGMRPDRVGQNTNGTQDIGLMQINSTWLPKLSKYNISRDDLFDGCKNAYVGLWILADNIARLGYSWDAVGAYNAASPEKRDRYARSVYRKLLAVQAGSLGGQAPAALARR